VPALDPHLARTPVTQDGDEVNIGPDRYEVVHIPGHATDHVSLIGDTAIFSGDVVVYNDAAFDDGSFGRTDRPGQSREDLIESLHRILDRLPAGVEHLYAGHGDPFHGDVRAVIERALERAERREPKYPE
jgi:glyoxylase-like metal-dependent hydrolase (beta-lactamase superfamily II)